MRRSFEKEFGASVSHSTNKFAWYGTTKRFATLSQTFVKTDLGTFNAHHYRYSPDMSTFLVECDAATWQAYGFEHKTIEQSQAICEQIFADTLDGHPLISNKSVWRNFPWIWNENWSHGNMVLIGDALHSAHFSIGSGTRLAIEDAIALTKALEAEDGDSRRPRPLPGRTQADREEAGDGGAHQRRLVRTFPRTHEARPDGFCLQLHHPLRADRRCAAARDVAGLHGALRGGKADREPIMTSADCRSGPVATMPARARSAFQFPKRYNASRILFDNLAAGRGERLALTGPGGTRNYAQLCAEAAQWGHGFQSLGLKRGDRILMFLDDTPAYPAAFFGAVRAGFVPLLINTLTPPDLLQFYLSDAGAAVAVADAEFTPRFNAEACKDTPLHTLIVVNGAAGEHAVPKALMARAMAAGTSRPILRKPTPTATRWRSGCIRPARPDAPRASSICSTTWPIASRRLRATC